MLAMLAAGSVGAQENSASSPPTSATTDAGFKLDYGYNYMDKRAIDERTIDRFGLFDRSDDGSGRYSVSLDLENEDSDWSFEVTVTMEF
jgi:hypothetical protein